MHGDERPEHPAAQRAAQRGIGLAFGGRVPVFDTALTVTTADAADALAAVLDGGSAVPLRGFGAVTVGASVGEAVVRATLLERCAAAVLAARGRFTTRLHDRAGGGVRGTHGGRRRAAGPRVDYLKRRHAPNHETRSYA